MNNEYSINYKTIIDLTHSFSSDTIYWPTEKEGFKLETEFEGKTEKGYFYAQKKFCAPEHGGTHLDAPLHFSREGHTIDQIDLQRLVGLAIVIDVSEQVSDYIDYQVTLQDIINWESKHSIIPDNSIILLYTGFSQFWPDRLKYLGTAQYGKEAVELLHFPGLHPDTAKWLVENRCISAVGIDTCSIDYGQSKLFESHRTLFENDIIVFENVTNLKQIPPTGAHVIALPMKIQKGSGAPLRIIAMIP